MDFKIQTFIMYDDSQRKRQKTLQKRWTVDVMEYKKEGYFPEALLNFLVRLGWSYGDQEIFSFDEMLKLFDPKDINKSASSYNLQKLQWLNTHYIQNSTNERLYDLLDKDFSIQIKQHNKKELLLNVAKQRAKTLKDIATNIKDILEIPQEYNQKDIQKSINQDTKNILYEFIGTLDDSMNLPSDFQMAIDRFLQTKDIKMPMLGKPLRIAIFGKSFGPSLGDILAILGKDKLKKDRKTI